MVVNGGKVTEAFIHSGSDIDGARTNGLMEPWWLTTQLLAVAVCKSERTTYDGENSVAQLHRRAL